MLASAASGGRLPASPPAREALETHVGRCPDCWATLARLHRTVTGRDVADADRARDLYGCDVVRDRLHALVGVMPAEMAERDPAAADHLAWCDGCRARFVELLRIEDALAAGTMAPLRVTTSRPEEPAPTTLGRLTIALGRGLAGFVETPAWMTMSATEPLLARGREPDQDLAREVHVPVSSGRVGARLGVRPRGADRADLEVCVPSPRDPAALVTLRSREDASVLVGAQSVSPDGRVVLRSVPAGRYLLELPPSGGAAPIRLEIDVRRA
jgi:hypothetical protein